MKNRYEEMTQEQRKASYDGLTLDEFMSKVNDDCSNVETCSSKSLQDWKRTDAECTAELSTFIEEYLDYYRIKTVELSHDGYTFDEFMGKAKDDCSNVETCSSKSLQDWKRTDAECTAELSTFIEDYLDYYRIKPVGIKEELSHDGYTLDELMKKYGSRNKFLASQLNVTTETIKVWKKEPISKRSGVIIMRLSAIYNIDAVILMGIK